MTRSAAAQANAAADALLAWLRDQKRAEARVAGASPSAPSESSAAMAAVPNGQPGESAGAASAVVEVPPDGTGADSSCLAPDADTAATIGPGPSRAGENPGQNGATLRLAHTDWLHHRLAIIGPQPALAAFRTAASGAGIIP